MRRVVVVGSGIAGLVAAIVASRTCQVTLVTKAELAESNTRYAQGGIAAAISADDSVDEHVADTLSAGAGLCDEDAVRILCDEGPGRITDLISLGVDFDRDGTELARGLEAAHSRARVLHAGGDATGAVIEDALVRHVRAGTVTVMEHTFLIDLVTSGNRVRGVEVIDASGALAIIEADAVVLASGGAGQLFRHTTNPSVATGDGAAAALRAGARLRDVEFYQFHPTALAIPGNYLVSEAVRGEGAVLRDRAGRRFMVDVHELAELAPRDIVARAIANRMSAQSGEPVFLDATALGAEFLARRFPSIDKACRAAGLDWSSTPIPVTPAAHYWMGGIQTDTSGRTTIEGLFAVGEVACTGVHGANRLASNSLLESLVFAWRAAEAIAQPWPAAVPTLRAVAGSPAVDRSRCNRLAISPSRSEVRDLAWARLGLFRDADGLREAVDTLAGWHATGESVADHETRNLVDIARAIAAAALAREESRGAHYRSDFPATSIDPVGGAPRLESLAC